MREPLVDWQRVLEDIAYLGLTGQALANRLGIRPALLARIAHGEKPQGAIASRFLALWMNLTGKSETFVPVIAPSSQRARFEVPNLLSDDEQEPAYVQLEAALMVWGRRQTQA